MLTIKEYNALFTQHLEQRITPKDPSGLYAPIHYILTLKAKRLRPVLTLMTADVFGAPVTRALNAALAVELFHNFTLIHDDIMDRALLRRGQPTVHEKWDLNTGILSGDVMLVMAMQCLEHYPPDTFAALSGLFHKTAVKVCEGQQYDMDFEIRQRVTIPEYLEMISCKTAVLVAAAMKMGAITAFAPQDQAEAIYRFGLNLGIAFQLKDDYLDTFGNAGTFGKRIGGDITANKKTFLYVKALETLDEKDAEQLQWLYSEPAKSEAQKIDDVKNLFLKSGADVQTLAEIERYTDHAFAFLEQLTVDAAAKTALRDFAADLMNRIF
ncbi:MAG: polyprenyl synthetase family protein [Sinomicrobium sp.]|nr:polyprenyl synthetase family protein [Sinomicrobium sp.]